MERFVILEDFYDSSKYINTYDDWELILGHVDNPIPSAKTDFVDNPGGDGTIDNTEALDEIKYNDRVISLPFTMKNKFNDIEEVKSKIANYTHGKRFKIRLYKDLGHYYVGRVSMQDFAINKATGTFNLVANCKSYKYKNNITSLTYTINGTKTLNIPNERKNVVPKITLDNTMQIEFEGNTYSLSSGEHEILNIYLKEGNNELIVTGNGTINFEFQEASL